MLAPETVSVYRSVNLTCSNSHGMYGISLPKRNKTNKLKPLKERKKKEKKTKPLTMSENNYVRQYIQLQVRVF